MIANASTRGFARSESLGKPVHYHQQNAEGTTFEDESFDFVMALEVLRYLDSGDNDAALREIYRVLRPGGRIGFPARLRCRRGRARR